MADYPGAPRPWPTLGKLLAALVAAGVLVAGLLIPYVGGIGLFAGHESAKFLDTVCHLRESKPPQKTTLYARDGKTVIANIFSQDRVPVTFGQIPPYLRAALVATEDRRFYEHHGVDMRGLLRSAISTSNGDTQGGSTLTMQYVKQIRYYQAGNNVKKQQAAIAQNLQRKMEDAKCALYIENTLHESKDEILTNYLNIAFFGEHSYGIQTAAETYFNKPVSQLNLDESAMLVGLLRAPSAYDPFVNRSAATVRRNEVLQNLVAVGKLPQSEATKLERQPIRLATEKPPTVHEGCANSVSTIQNAAFFCEFARNWLINVDHLTETQLETGGLKIVTTLSPRVQNSAQRRIEKAVPPSSPMTAVLPVLDPKTGDVLAMATSKQFGTKKGQTEQPVFTQAIAQAASTYKLFPLLVALATGVPPNSWQLKTADSYGTYKPSNCLTSFPVRNGDPNEHYYLNETLDSATAKSDNTFFVGLADQLLGCNLAPIVQMAKDLGITALDQPGDSQAHGQSIGQEIVNLQRAQQLTLGSVNTSALEIAGAYAAVANGGVYNTPSPIISITNDNGNALPVHRTPGKQVVAPQVAAQAVHALIGDTVANGTSAGVFGPSWYPVNSSKIAGKTGTQQAALRPNKNSAIWFVGMTPRLVAADAIFNIDNPGAVSRGLPGVAPGEAYGDYASKVWLQALEPVLRKRQWTWPDPNTVPGQPVPDISGMSPGDARKLLAADNFKMQRLGADSGLLCPDGNNPLDTVGYYAPKIAKPGSTITMCVSSGVSQPVYVYIPPPPPPPPPAPAPTPSPGGNGGGGNGGGGNGGGGNGGGGNGGGGNGGGGNGGGGGTGGGGGGGHGGGGGGTGGGGGGGTGGGGHGGHGGPGGGGGGPTH